VAGGLTLTTWQTRAYGIWVCQVQDAAGQVLFETGGLSKLEAEYRARRKAQETER
jgi:hypothetical protein